MIEDLIIHIGSHKAGTTSLQMAFYRGNINADIFYPKAHPDSAVMHNHNWYARSVGTEREESVMQYMKDQIKDKKRVVISAAWYTYLHPERLNRHIKEHYAPLAKNIRIIRYLRPALEYWKSSYIEGVKIGEVRTDFETYYRTTSHTPPIYYDNIISRLQQDYDITTKPFVKEDLYKNDIVDDFLHYCVGDNYEVTTRSIENVGLSVQYLSAVMYMHTLFYDRSFDEVRNDGYIITKALKNHVSVKNPVPYRLPPNIIQEIATDPRYTQDAAAVDKLLTPGKFYLSNNLKTHLDNLHDQPVSLKVEDWHTPEAIEMMKAWAEFYMITENFLKK